MIRNFSMTFNEAAAVSQPYHLFRISHPENVPWCSDAAFLDQMAQNARKKTSAPSVSPENVGNSGTSGRFQSGRPTAPSARDTLGVLGAFRPSMLIQDEACDRFRAGKKSR
jgi:hypothetical protein